MSAPGITPVLRVDSLGGFCNGMFGCSSVTTYVENVAGVGAGLGGGEE